MFKTLGVPELLLILGILILVFGVGKLPQAGESIGKAICGFKKDQSGDEEKPS